MALRKILFVSHMFYPDQVATSNLFTKLFERIAETESYSITVWCAQPFYTTRSRQPFYRRHKQMDVYCLASTNFSKERLTARFVNMLTYTVSVFFRLLFLKRYKFDLLFVHTAPPFLAILVILLAKFKRVKVVYVLMDIFPDGLFRLNKVSPNNPFIKIWKNWHRKVMLKSDRVVAIGRDMLQWAKSEVPSMDESRLKYLPLWQDEKTLNPIDFELNPFVKKYRLSNYFVVQFSGNMGLWNDLETVGKAVGIGIDGVKFVFIGDGIRKKELISAMGHDGLNRTLFFDFLSNEEYAYSVTACHCGLVTLLPKAVGMGVPSKIFGIMAAGIPVLAIAPKYSEIAMIVNESECGLVSEPGDVKSLIDNIAYLKQNEPIRMRMGINARKAFDSKYTTAKGAENYITLFNELLQ